MDCNVRRCNFHLRISSLIFNRAFFEIPGLRLQKSLPLRLTPFRGRNVPQEVALLVQVAFLPVGILTVNELRFLRM